MITPVPALVVLLLAEEKMKGLPLAEHEVASIAHHAQCIAMPRHARRKLDEARGYDDIDPEHAWEQWQQVRQSVSNGG